MRNKRYRKTSATKKSLHGATAAAELRNYAESYILFISQCKV